MKSFPASVLLVVALCVTALSLGYIVFNASPSSPLTIVPISQVAQVSTDGLVSYWKFDEGSGSSVSSSVGGASDTLGSPSWITGKVNTALNFTGADFVNIGDPSLSSFTISAWIKPASNGNYGSIVMKQNTYGLETQGNTVYARIGNGDGWNPGSASNLGAAITTGSWQLVTQTYNASTKEHKLYVNKTAKTGKNVTAPVSAGAPFLIGTWDTSMAEPFLGGIDEVRVYNRALSASEVAQLVDGSTPPPPPATDTTAPSISSVSSSNINETSATVSWSTNEASDTQIEYGLTTAYGSNTGADASMVTSHSQTLTGLTGGTVYNYRVKSRDAAGNLATSGNYKFTTATPADVTAPTVPTNLNASSVSQSSLTLSWTASMDNVGVTGYRVFRNGSLVKTVTGTSFSDSGLSKATTYTYTVDAFDAEGNRSGQASKSVTTADNTAPTVTLGTPSVSGYAPTTVTLTATASDVDGTISSVSFYNGTTLLGTDTSSPYSYSWTNVAAGAYSITARATDNDGAVTTSASVIATVSPAPVTSTLLRYWSFNQSSGTTATDSSGNSGSATLVGSPTWTTGVAGNGLSFNGTSAYLNAGNVGSSAFTLSAWVNMSSTDSGWRTIVMKQNSFGLEVQNGKVYANIGNGSSWTNTVSASLVPSVWKHVVQTYDGTTNRLYIDGALAASGAGSLTNTSTNLLIGSWNGSSEFFNGKIDEVRVYNSALTATEVKNLFTAVTPPATNTDTTAPTTPTNLTATAVSSSQINLSWTASSDNVGVIGYQVFRNGVQIANITPAATTFQNTTGLTPNTSYSYTVRAYDATGNVSAASASASATTQPGTAPTSYSVTITKSGTGSGTVISTGSINCGTTCTSTGDAGQTVTLTATPATGSTFTGWTGVTGCSTAATCSFTLNANTTVTATFMLPVVTGTTFYVRPGGTGNGSDWTNALGVLPANPARGTTYYVAGGSYPAYKFSTPVSGTTLVTIKKATTADHGTDTGWVSTYGTTQAVFNASETGISGVSGLSGINFATGYVVFDGQSRTDMKSGHGFKVVGPAPGGAGIRIGNGATIGANGVTIKNTAIVGHGQNAPGNQSDGPGGDNGVWLDGTSSGLTLANNYLYSWGGCMVKTYSGSIESSLFDNNWFEWNSSSAAHHAEGVFAWGMNNTVFKNNVWVDIEGTGIVLMGNGGNNDFYGNLVYWTSLYPRTGQNDDYISNGAFTSWSAYTTTNNEFYNNTVILPSRSGGYEFGMGYINNNTSSGTARNNLYYAPTTGRTVGSNGVNSNYDMFYNVGHAAQTNGADATGNPFKNSAAYDFNLNVNTPAGTNLGSTYAVDMTGKTRTTWTRGAFEYTGTTSNIAPTVTLGTPSVSGTAPATVTLTATASDVDGTISSVSFYNGTTLLGTDTSSPYSYSWTSVPAGSYSVTARATDNGGAITTSSAVSLTVVAATAPSTKFTAGQSIKVSGTGTFLNIRSTLSTTGTVLGTATDGTVGIVVTNASNGVYADGYYWWYVALNGVTGWVVQDYLVVNTVDTSGPTTPTGLTATAVSSSQINLSWAASSDNVGVAGYRIVRNGTQIALVTSGTTYQNTGLTASTAYSYTVAAYDAAGNASAPSTAVSATTPPATTPTGTSYYMTPSGAGTKDGSSWANAFAGTSGINWSKVVAGTTLYVGAGSYGSLTVGSSGTSATNRVTIKAAQDTNVGVATFGAISYDSRPYVTIDGGYNGQRNFTTSSTINGQWTVDPGLHYITINGAVADFRYVSKGEFSYNYASLIGSQEETTFYFVGSVNRQNPSFGLSKFHHNTIIVPGKINNGNGPDGIHAGTGFDIYNNTFQALNDERYDGAQHQDLIQMYGDEYIRVYNNDFIDSGDSQVDFSDSGNTTKDNLYVYNNVFRRTIDGMGTVMFRMYTDSGGKISSVNNVHINNNTFVDGTRTGASFGAAIRMQALASTAVGNNSEVRNNYIYNSGDGWAAVLWEGPATGWAVSNNIIAAGSQGNTNVSGVSGFTISTASPAFVSYTPYSLSNNLHITSASPVINLGYSLSSFSTDKDGVSRPQGSAWDIGAYEYTGATGPIVYVRPGATGTGTDWANARGTLPSPLARGTTYYVGSGSYGAYTFNTSGTSGTATVLKALDNATCASLGMSTVQCHGTDVGWNDSYGTGAATFSSWGIIGGNLTIDGQKGAGSLNLNSIDYGFKVSKPTGYVVCIGGACAGNQTTLSNLTIKHTEIQGGGDDGANCTLHNKGIFMYYGSYSNINIAYNYIHDVGNMTLDLQNMTNGIVEYNYIARNESLNTSGCEEHSEGLFGDGSNNSIVRYNAWEDIEGTGVIMMSGSGWQVYGNVIFRTGNSKYSNISNGSIAGWSSKPFSNSFVYNNTIANCLGVCGINPGGSGNSVANNIVMDTASYVPSRFVNAAQKNFRLSSPYAGGTTLSSTYNKDMDGKTRGADDVWDMGAFEY